MKSHHNYDFGTFVKEVKSFLKGVAIFTILYTLHTIVTQTHLSLDPELMTVSNSLKLVAIFVSTIVIHEKVKDLKIIIY